MAKDRTGHRGAGSYVARCCARLTGECKKRGGLYRTTSKHPRWGRCPSCDSYVESMAGAVQWITRGQRVRGDRGAGYG